MSRSLVFSGTWSAISGALLYAASSQNLETFRVSGFATVFFGTLAVYNIDRLRDIDRDRTNTPKRSAFVELHQSTLWILVCISFILAVGLVAPFSSHDLLILLPALLLGLFHRRLKNIPNFKPYYVSGAWTLVLVGLPAKESSALNNLLPLASLVAVCVFANTLVSGAKFKDSAKKMALGLTGAGVFIAIFSGDEFRSLISVPAILFIALLPARSGEWYRLCVPDGALALGATVAVLTSMASNS